MIRRKSRMFKYKSSQKNYYLFRDLLSHGQYLICYLIGKNLLEYVILRIGDLSISYFKKKTSSDSQFWYKFNELLDLKMRNVNTSEYSYMTKLDKETQDSILEKLSSSDNEKKEMSVAPLRAQLLTKKGVPKEFIGIALQKIKDIEQGPSLFMSQSNQITLNWIQKFLTYPFDSDRELPVDKDNIIECQQYLQESKQILDNSVYGMNRSKEMFLELLAQWLQNPKSAGTSIALKGPMGTGKTTLIKEGVSKMLNREFVFIPLGGVSEASYLCGMEKAYVGSQVGKIIDSLTQCKSSNPVIFFDELDKVETKGAENSIYNILIHLTDPIQNREFHDKSFSEIHFDLSKCLFIFSYNDENRINPILRDRLYNIPVKGYNEKEKYEIAKSYMIPNIEKEFGYSTGEVILNQDIINIIIRQFTVPEEGVRNLKRSLETIFRKINYYRMLSPDLKKPDIYKDVQFPCTVSSSLLDKLLEPSVKEVLNFYL